MPHMHLLGRDMRLIATTPTGEVHDLIWIKDWDFNWQDVYHYREPLFLPAGTRVKLVAHFDNSAENPANPHDPPIPVGWGEKTTDEMCIGFLVLRQSQRIFAIASGRCCFQLCFLLQER